MDLHNFRIIVVGGGPVGLISAHILSQAGFDFVILERYQSVTPEAGNAVALWPQNIRVIDQLGLFDALKALAVPLSSRICLTHQGQVFSQSNAFYNPKPNHGYTLDMFHRHSFLSTLYDSLSEENKSRIKVNKHVTRIEFSESDGTAPVRVVCADGSIEEGDIVIGADGVHSTVRDLMQQAGGEAVPSRADAKHQWKTTYRTLFGSLPRAGLGHADLTHLTFGHVYESHGPGTTGQFFVGPEKAWFFVYSKINLDGVRNPEDSKDRYSQQDADEYAAALGDIHLAPKVQLRDAYADKTAANLTNLQEGIADRWSWGGRVVLVGDAVHKFTPNIGWGFNSGVHDLVVLANALRRLLLQPRGPDSKNPRAPTKQLEAVFSSYEKQRKAQASQICNLSGKYTRISGWNTPYKRFLDCRIFPAIQADSLIVTYAIGSKTRVIPVLDWLDESNFASGKIAWTHGRSGEQGHRTGLEKCKWLVIDFVMPAVIAVL